MDTDRLSANSDLQAVQAGSNEQSEADLVARAKQDPEAFGLLYDKHYSVILNYIYRRTIDVGLAEDLTAETFMKALRGLGKYQRIGSFRAWLYRIATNELKMHWRSASAARAANPGWREELGRIYFNSKQPEASEDAAEKMQTFALVRKCMLVLPDRYQTALVLRYFEDLPLDEVSRVMGKKLGTVKSLIHRGLKLLAGQIGREDATFLPKLHHLETAGGTGGD